MPRITHIAAAGLALLLLTGLPRAAAGQAGVGAASQQKAASHTWTEVTTVREVW